MIPYCAKKIALLFITISICGFLAVQPMPQFNGHLFFDSDNIEDEVINRLQENPSFLENELFVKTLIDLITTSKNNLFFNTLQDALLSYFEIRLANPTTLNFKILLDTFLRYLCKQDINDSLLHIIENLLIRGADINAPDANGSTALHYALFSKFFLATTPSVQQNNDDSLIKHIEGPSPLASLNEEKISPLARLLLHYNTNPNASDSRGFSLLHYAVIFKSISLATALLAQGALPNNITLKNKRTPLHIIAENPFEHDLQMATLLLQYGAKVNAQDSSLETPLHKAARANNFAIAEFLLTHEALCLIKNNNNLTAFDIAAIRHHEKPITELLAAQEIINEEEFAFCIIS